MTEANPAPPMIRMVEVDKFFGPLHVLKNINLGGLGAAGISFGENLRGEEALFVPAGGGDLPSPTPGVVFAFTLPSIALRGTDQAMAAGRWSVPPAVCSMRRPFGVTSIERLMASATPPPEACSVHRAGKFRLGTISWTQGCEKLHAKPEVTDTPAGTAYSGTTRTAT